MHEFKVRLSREAWVFMLVAMAMVLSLLSCIGSSGNIAFNLISIVLTAMSVILAQDIAGSARQCFYDTATTMAVAATALATAVTAVQQLMPGLIIPSLAVIAIATIVVTALYLHWLTHIDRDNIAKALLTHRAR